MCLLFSSEATLYTDGVQSGWTFFGPAPSSAGLGRMVIGKRYADDGETFISSVSADELLFWNKDLSELEIGLLLLNIIFV